MQPALKSRHAIPKDLQVRVFRRDRWLCYWCGRPVVFAPTLKLLERWLKNTGCNEPLAYHDVHWRRDRAPLLDCLAAVIDHFEAHSSGGSDTEDNLVTSCNKCNLRKSDARAERFRLKSPLQRVRSKYGEPEHWDGFSSLFDVLANEIGCATQSQREWLAALKQERRFD